MELGRQAAGHNAGLGGHGGLHQTRVETHAGVVDEELVGPADAGHAPIFVHAHEVIGVEVVFAVNVVQLEEHFVIQPAGTDGLRGEQQDAGARAVGQVVVTILVLDVDLDLVSGQRESDGIVIPV